MPIGSVNGLLEHIRPAQGYLQGHFGLDASTAVGVVQDVLLRLFLEGPAKLRRSRRYFFSVCRSRALHLLRDRRRREKAFASLGGRLPDAENKCEVLIALEPEDKRKFFEQALSKQR